MTDRRIVTLLYVLVALVVVNLGATFYFQLSRPRATSDVSIGSDASAPVSDNSGATLAKTVVDLYNSDDTHGLYMAFDAPARGQFTEQSLVDKLAQIHRTTGRVVDYTYTNTEEAGKDASGTYLYLNYNVHLAGGTFSRGTMRLTVMMKGGEPRLYGFFITGLPEQTARSGEQRRS
ncbi:hypothetical protein [Dyella psychrodurans]|uniref:DUF4019 domain-containing protein n=1 Tax=Dyella psychrodurans TaxID=1927960 RepID=A0A370X2X7_9GAMM|nr:hypothetical protein [Dyella psychrodurans]RDS82706.1 hypothetical protein DWU99_15090 [Dyella psychrodurans]